MRERFENIQALRGVAALGVVFFHVKEDFFDLGAAGVDLFFVISGFVMVLVARDRFGASGLVPQFFYNRASRIYPLYWIYSALTLTVYLLPATAVDSSWGQIDFVSSFLILPQEGRVLLTVGWTLVHELYFYGIFALLLLEPERRLGRWLALWTAAVVVGRLAFDHVAGSWLAVATDPLTLEFIAGCLIAKVVLHGWVARGASALVAGGLLLVAGWSLYYHATANDQPDGWIRALLWGLPSALIVYGVLALEVKEKWKCPRILRLVGDASYSLYLSHLLVLAVVRRAWEAFSERGWTEALGGGGEVLFVVAMVGSAALFSLISYRLIERPLTNLTRKVKVSPAASTS